MSAAENLVVRAGFAAHRGARDLEERREHVVWQPVGDRQRVTPARIGGVEHPALDQCETAAEGGEVERHLLQFLQDRKSVGTGKRWSVRVDFGARRLIKKK